jgi:hypothetical protein
MVQLYSTDKIMLLNDEFVIYVIDNERRKVILTRECIYNLLFLMINVSSKKLERVF